MSETYQKFSKVKDSMKNPIFWGVSVALFTIMTVGLFVLVIIGLMNSSNTLSFNGAFIVYGLLFFVFGVALGFIMNYASRKKNYEMNYLIAMYPFFGVAILTVVFLIFGFWLGLLFLFGLIGAMFLAIPYSLGYFLAEAVMSKPAVSASKNIHEVVTETFDTVNLKNSFPNNQNGNSESLYNEVFSMNKTNVYEQPTNSNFLNSETIKETVEVVENEENDLERISIIENEVSSETSEVNSDVQQVISDLKKMISR